jgi:pimeloyl-ACP methyl ester carboxylesterase
VDSFQHDGLTFDVSDSGPADGRVVVLLHGFPEDRLCWDRLTPYLVDAGYRVLAPDQRGYSPGARPGGRRAYALDRLAGDVLALADAAGAVRFDVVGHDWGAVVAWHLAGAHSERVRSLTALSVPHSQAMLGSLLRSSQLLHSWYMFFFQIPNLPEQVFARGGEQRFADQLRRSGLDSDSAQRYARRVSTPGAMTGPLNWYRALPLDARLPDRGGAITSPTLFIWGERDQFITRVAAERCADHVVGPYLFVPLAGGSHWLPSGSVGEVGPALLDHLAGEAAD